MPALSQLSSHPWLVLGLRGIVASVFLLAAVPKLLDPAVFAQDIANYQLLPASLVPLVAVALPVVELVVAAALITGIHARGAAVVACGLLAAFVVAMLHTTVQGIDLACGCFGSETEAVVGWGTVARNVGLMACGAVVAAGPDTSWRTLVRPREIRSGAGPST
jgi:uncharacterized membrane protein YphA (DoxX/SURF4 family)